MGKKKNGNAKNDPEPKVYKPVFNLESDYYDGLRQIAENMVPRPDPEFPRHAKADDDDVNA